MAIHANKDMTMAAPVGLYLIVEAMPAAASIERLRAALQAARFASVLIVAAGDQKLDAGLARPFVEAIQAADAAALIDNDAQLARTLRADGVHLRASDTLEARAKEAREILGARYIVGAQAASRHDAMMLGELGAEYVAFDTSDDQADLVSWWAEIFEIPCVAFDLASPETATEMAQAGADFVAFRIDSAGTAADVQDQVRAFTASITAKPSA
jgi:thiamine-phosphate pyrophosphorylase